MMKVCTKCGHGKPLAAYHKDRTAPDGHCSKCKECKRAAVYAHRAANPAAVAKSYARRCERKPNKHNAQEAIVYAVKAGLITRAPRCQMCGRACKTDAHHADYSRPFAVIWVCRSCHAYADAQRRKAEGREEWPIAKANKKRRAV